MVTIAGVAYHRVERFKQDAFAATARYARVEGQGVGPAEVVVKFARTAPLLGLPLGWLGAHLSGKERDVHRRLTGIAGVPAVVDDVVLEGDAARAGRHALGRVYVEGRTLREVPGSELAAGFFAELEALLQQVHDRGIAVMDLNKAENVLVDTHGRPHLIDFQLSVRHGVGEGRRWWSHLPGARWWLGVLQGCDRFYIAKQFARTLPDAFAEAHGDLEALRPGLTRWWRRLTKPTTAARRKLLVALRVRSGTGHADTERPAPRKVADGAASPSSDTVSPALR